MANFYCFYPPVGGGSSANASVGSNGAIAPTSSTEVAGINPSGNLQPISTDASGNQNVNVVSSTLPTGGATAANQVTGNNSLADIDTHVVSMDTKTPALGQALAAASSPVVLPAAQITALTPPTTVTVTQATGTNLHAVIDSGTVVLGAGAAAIGSVSVSNFPSSQTISGNVTVVQPTGTNLHAVLDSGSTTTVTQATGTNLHTVVDSGTVVVTQPTGTNLHTVIDSGTLTTVSTVSAVTTLGNITGTITLPTNASTSALQTSGNTSLTTIATNTGNIPAKGTATTANSTPVNIASDQVVPIKPGNGTLTDNSGSTSGTPSTSTTLMASNANRKYLLIQNLSTTANMYINFTSAATVGTGSILLLPSGSFSQESGFVTTEAITVLSASASVPYTAKQA